MAANDDTVRGHVANALQILRGERQLSEEGAGIKSVIMIKSESVDAIERRLTDALTLIDHERART